jgi:tRNA(Ile)-lysidine synthase
MHLQARFNKHWAQTFPQFSADGHFVLAVSGGADSVVLAHLLKGAGINFEIAHCNFGLRGAESDRDEKFVNALAVSLDVPFHVKHFDTAAYAAELKISIQEAARDLRYAWFATFNTVVITAHHANDNIETVFMHLCRGTGIAGLTGIEPYKVKERLLRPLLIFHKQEILDYANEAGIAFVEDSSNSSDKYARNFFRHQVLPAVQEVYPQSEQNILHTIKHLREVSEVYKTAMQKIVSKLQFINGNEIHIPVLMWQKSKPLDTITFEMLYPFGFTAAQVPEAIKLLSAHNGAVLISPTHRLIKNRNWMIVAPLATAINTSVVVVEQNDASIDFPAGTLTLQTTIAQVPDTSDNNTCMLDAAALKFPLILRPAATGDYFYPLGMQKKKKLSKFFIDLKLSKTAKEKVWVLVSDNRIAWVIGYRIDNRFKITPASKNAVKLNLLAPAL